MADMTIGELFEKAVDRPIDGVIRAAETSHLATEVDEYVLTNEGEKYLSRVLEAYTDYKNANGVWISGFFGSGKSHMLKMLAYMLGEVAGETLTRGDVSTSFRGKTDDEFLRGLIDKAAAVPATSILFNIAEQASDKGQSGAILRAFTRMFNEARGYEGKLPYVARFERDLDSAGQLDAFKAAFREISGSEWESKRDKKIFADQYAGKAFAAINGSSDAPEDVLGRYQALPPQAIDDFTDDVHDWLTSQGASHRLLFLVDEIGQFLGGDVGLMLELQTIAESLNTKCAGRAWVFVTSQEDMERVVGVQSKEQENDFSKIRDRFKTRVNLTSYDVAEVIRKRLLLKKRAVESTLENLYEAEKANFKIFFDLSEGGGKVYKNYPSSAQFVDTYPFIDYQFALFHQAMIGLSNHNAFEGRHAAVGERSMLAATQQVASTVLGKRVGALTTFDRFYDGLEADIKSAAKGQIEQAKQHMGDDEMAIRLLKALFLTKYVDEFTGNIRNLSILLFDSFARSIPHLKDNIKAALEKLEAQTYIQRSGDVYSYLTNDEKVMEEEIKAITIDTGELLSHLQKTLAQDVVKTSKFVYKKSGQDFPFGWMVDDQAHGQQKPLTLHISTPLNAATPDALRMQSAGKYELRVILDADKQLIPDYTLYLKTEKYVKQKNSPNLSSAEIDLLGRRSQANTARRKELVERLRKAVGTAALVVNAQEVPSSAQDAITHLEDGFQALVPHTYPSLNILGNVNYVESDIAKFAVGDGDKLIGDEGISKLEPVANEVLARITLLKNQGAQSTVRTLVDHFETRPYGWPLAATLCAIARLLSSSRLTGSLDGNVLKKADIVATLRNTASQSKTVLSVPTVIDPTKVQRLRTFVSDFFNEGNSPADPIDLARHVSERLQAELDKLRAMRSGSIYPFLTQLDGPIALLEPTIGHGEDWYFDQFAEHEDALREARSDVISPIEQFLNGEQRGVYDGVMKFLQTQAANLGYAPADLVHAVQTGLDDPSIFRGKRLPNLKKDAEELESAIAAAVESARRGARAAVENRFRLISEMSEYSGAEEQARLNVQAIVEAAVQRAEQGALVASIQQVASAFESADVPKIIAILTPADDEKLPIALKSIKIAHGLVVIDSSEALEKYLSATRTALEAVLNNGDRITV